MALDTAPIELRAYDPAATGSYVYNAIWGLVEKGVPVSSSVKEAYFHVRENGRKRLQLALGSGLSWNNQTKTVHIQITNEQVAFLRSDMDLDYSFYVVWDYGLIETLKEGAVTAVRVA